MSLKTLQNNISAIQERKKFDIASIMAAQTAQQNQETIGKFIKFPKNSPKLQPSDISFENFWTESWTWKILTRV